MISKRLTPRTAFVIGASRGIGFAAVEAFLADGYVVAATHRGSGAPTGSIGFDVDIRNHDGIKESLRIFTEEHGRLDTLVVNAGIVRQDLLLRLDIDSLREVFEVNTFGAMMAVRHAQPRMKRNAGSVVLISSESAKVGIPGSSHYTASKAALEGFMRSAMWELGKQGIRINVIAPGPTETDMLQSLYEPARARLLSASPLGRFAEPREIAEVIRWASQSTYLNGASIPVTGGEGLGF